MKQWEKMRAVRAIAGVEDAHRRYRAQRGDLLHPAPPAGGSPVMSSSISRPAERIAERLEKLDEEPWVREMRMVDKALLEICGGMPERKRRKTIRALVTNLQRKGMYQFEYLGIDWMSRRSFYRLRERLVALVARRLTEKPEKP